MTQMMIVPKTIGKINYTPSINKYTIVYKPSVVDPETRKDLKDRKHLSVVRKVREEYKKGELIDEKEIIIKLKR